MSNRYKGGVISATPPTTTGGEDGTASGAWTLEQQMQLQAAGLWPAQPTGPYIEQVFSTYLYTGNGSTQTITNGINLSGKGGMVWAKMRSNGSVTGNVLFDTVRGASQKLESNSTGASSNWTPYGVSAFGSTGFTVADDGAGNYITNNSGVNYASWTFREQAKFFDIVTYTGNGSTLTISHNLGSVPGCIIVKNTSSTMSWVVYHRSNGNDKVMYLNGTQAVSTDANVWNSYTPTSTNFQVGGSSFSNSNGDTYVAYLFAHNAGGFGLNGTDNVISCGSYTGNGAAGGQLINLGYEAQWVMIKNASSAADWWMLDTMRGWVVNGDFGSDQALFANSSAAEQGQVAGQPDALGFRPIQDNVNQSGQTYIYIAIRRGPMRTPTTGTSVFTTRVATEVEYNNTADFGITTDLLLNRYYKDGSQYTMSFDRLRGSSKILYTPLTDAEGSLTLGAGNLGFGAAQTSVTWAQIANSSVSNVTWAFKRAPSFFDEVCYSGTGGSGQTIPHNLGVAPELLIFKKRNSTSNWTVVMPAIGGNAVSLNLNDYGGNSNIAFVSSFGTSSITTAAGYDNLSESGSTYVAYFFATCPGVSKVGNYAGTGAALTVDCGFTSGARFVMIKRLDGTNIYRGWYVWDSARGITSGNDPYLLMNNTDAETTGTNYVDSASSGFTLTTDSAGASGGALNASGGTYIFLAIA